MEDFLDSTFQDGNTDVTQLLLIFIFGGVLLLVFVDYIIKRRATISIDKYQYVFRELIKRHLIPDRNVYKYDWQPVVIPLEDFRKYNLGNKSIRSALVHTILEIYAVSNSQKRTSLRKLYRDLDLELYTIMELKTLKGDDLALAIKELAEMDILVEKHRMRRFLKHKSPRIRKITRTYFHKIYFSKKVELATD